MPLAGRDYISIADLSDGEMLALFALADRFSRDMEARRASCQGKLLATLFYEPSTRTRLSFESAMLRLGGGVVSCPDAKTSSVAKGETIADTVRIVASYVDLIVIRNPLEGSARVAAEYANVPVINGGDGAHEHPTQTLLDLYTILREKGKLAGTRVALVGDLKHGRTAHSLAFGLARFGAQIACIAPKGLEMPDHVLGKLSHYFALKPEQYASLAELVPRPPASGRRKQLALGAEAMSLFDVIYVTRVQKERFRSEAEFAAVASSYQITAEALKKARPDALVMHPLPRVDELDYRIDADPRAAYFRQAAYGLPVRMALISVLLGAVRLRVSQKDKTGFRPPERQELDLGRYADLRCDNPRCVTALESYLRPVFEPVPRREGAVACSYCDHEQTLPTSAGGREQ
jgi:aspartate carbamoyltransferase catalytic subunit